MKTRRLVLPCLAILAALPLAKLDTAFAESFPVRQEFGQTRATGRATLSESPEGHLVLSNIGATGDDGIEFDAGMTRGPIGPIRWMAPEALTGRGISFYVGGTDAAGNPATAPYSWTSVCLDDGSGGGAPMYGLRLDNLDPAVTMVTLRVNDGDNPIYEGRHAVGENPLFGSNSQATGASAGGEVIEESIIFEYGSMKLEYPPGTRFDLPTGETLVGNQVVVEAEMVDTEMVALRLSGVHVFEPSGSIGEMIFTDWPAGMFGKMMMALGEAEVLGIGSSGLDEVDRLQVSNIGSSGEDGVACVIEDESTAQYFALDFGTAPLAGNKLFVGGLSWDTDDTGGNPPPVVRCEYNVDSFFDIWTEISVHDPPSRIEYLVGHEIVHTVQNPSVGARVHTSVQWPYRLGYASTPEGDIGVEILFASPVTFRDDTGIDQDCDGVRLVHPPDPGKPFHSIDGLFVRAADVSGGSFEVAGLPNIHPPDPGSPWTAEALGAANLVLPGDGSLIVDNVDPAAADDEPGLGGVIIYTDLNHASWGVTLNTRSKRPPPTRGHVTVLKVLGGGGGKTHFRGYAGTIWARGNDLDTQIEYSADMSAFGDGDLVWNFYDDGQLVGSTTRAGGDYRVCFSVDGAPRAFTGSLGHPDGRPRMIVDIPDDSPVTLLGGTKAGPAMNKADLVEVVHANPIVTPFTDVTGVEIRGAGQGAFHLTDIGPKTVSGVPLPAAASVLRLHPAAPNPFNPRTVIAFDLARDAEVGLSVYDLRGRLVRNIFRGPRTAGTFRETWDGLDDDGRGLASGTYFFRLSGAGEEKVRKAVLVR